MAYHALYRKYRPTRFGEVIGQEHITTILKNQVRSGRIAHAYLFSGSRGTGKTTTARILARAINCLNIHDGEPCGECEACSLSAADSIDIIEMDAASNSKVDEMRALLDKAEFAPIYLKTKVYIIDEAHMLSKSANNALLKTLEEPPAHVVFILATTEPQSLPATILSRCQRFDFKRLSVADMTARAKLIAKNEGITVDCEALMCIARAADGAMRDCLSILDQCLSFCGDKLTKDDVLSVLGSMNADFMFEFANDIINSNAASVMKKINEVISGGHDIGVFVRDISSHFRSLLITKLCGRCADILECTEDVMSKYMEQSKNASKARLERALDELMLLQSQMRLAAAPRVLIESSLLKICHPEEQAEITALADRIDELEKKLAEGKFVSALPDKPNNSDNADVSDTDVSDAASSDNDKVKAKNDGSAAAGSIDNSGAENGGTGAEYGTGLNPAEIPPSTAEADGLYKKFMAGLMKADITLGIQLQLASTHFCRNETLYLCFDKSRSSNYNYANASEAKAKFRRIAAETIAPYNAEIILADGNSAVKRKIPAEIFGVAITEE